MRTYAAVGATSKQHRAILTAAKYPHILYSYFYDGINPSSGKPKELKLRFAEQLDHGYENLMLDSGAFSAYSLGNDIPLDNYIEWSRLHADHYPMARITNLDVIPRRKGDADSDFHWVPSREEIDRAVQGGIDNAVKIRAAGLRCIEVYHLFEPLDAWRGMIERRQEGEVLGIGGLGFSAWGQRETRRWHGDACFAVIKEMCGWDAVPPIHAFGGVTDDILWRYPLSSCDASSWISPARWGQRASRNRVKRKNDGRHQMLNWDMAVGEAVKILEGYMKRDAHVGEHWQRRGVTFLPEGPAYVDRPVAA